MESQRLISGAFQDALAVKQHMFEDPALGEQVVAVADLMCSAFRSGGRVLWCGNGGSAADSQHLAAELSGRFYMDRAPLDSEALTDSSAYLTAISNDYSFEIVFSRLVEAKGRRGDVLIGLSTSGNSMNVAAAMKAAGAAHMVRVGMTGSAVCQLDSVCDIVLHVPSTDTPRIQEAHMLIGHTLCQLVERSLFQGADGQAP